MSENRLGRETSPYLLQHQDNPVHWWAWGPEALAEAKRTGKPILLSVGYAACHWCHVMAHESFEDDATADVMNELFVNIKVDREERPGHRRHLHERAASPGRAGRLAADHVPRQRRQAVLGRHLLPQGAALRQARRSRPCCARWHASIATSRTRSATTPELLVDALGSDRRRPARPPHPQRCRAEGPDDAHGRRRRHNATAACAARPSFRSGVSSGCSGAAASASTSACAVRRVEVTLTNICQGGIYDHLGGGFARYSVDARWLAPHFEKMLYDNALLVDLLTEVWRETRNPLFKARVEETVAWLMREMIAGWRRLCRLARRRLGRRGRQVLRLERAGDRRRARRRGRAPVRARLRRHARRQLGRPHDPQPPVQSGARLARRRRPNSPSCAPSCWRIAPSRIRPGWDDKVLADWNGLMIAALARAARVFDKPDWLGHCRARLRLRRTADDRRWPPDARRPRRPASCAGHRERLRQHDLGRAAPPRGDQRRRLSEDRRSLERHSRPPLLVSR